MQNAGLVLEGGGMKGLYTAGVLDYFLEKDLFFINNYGVSAGAVVLSSYLSKQSGRTRDVYLTYMNDPRYYGLRNLLTTGDIFGAKFCYETLPEQLLPFDYDTYKSFPGNAYAVAVEVESGNAEYLPMRDLRKDMTAVRCSASLPLVSRMVPYLGKRYLDGGITDSIPLAHAIADGNVRNVVVLTKGIGFRREPMSATQRIFTKLCYPRHKKMVANMVNRHSIYNASLDLMEHEVENGRAFVIRPQTPNTIKRLEKDPTKLKALYYQGYEDAKRLYPQLMEFLGRAD